jgi:hypothetical protein
VSAQRNAEAEGMCQPFLTSNFSSPLIPDIRRNLKIDEGKHFHSFTLLYCSVRYMSVFFNDECFV